VDTARIVHNVKTMLDHDIFIDPLLVNTHFRDQAHPLYAKTEALVEDIYQRCVRVEEFGHQLEDVPFSPTLMRYCLMDTLLSTAMSRTFEAIGSVVPSEADLELASRALHDLIDKVGVDGLYILYFVIVGKDIVQPVFYYNGIREADFLDASHHHPYRPEQMDLFLMMGVARRSFRVKTVGDQRYVQLTRLGHERFRWTVDVLEKSGYDAKRVPLSYVYQFDSVADWDHIYDVVWPDHLDARRQFVRWLNVSAGNRVLEVGCGTGPLTWEAGLVDAEGSKGQWIAVDVSTGKLKQAEPKGDPLGDGRRVSLQHASLEHLPFRDDTFDMCVGSAFLQFTNPTKALCEMTRVVVPGGTVGLLQALACTLDKPFFLEWFHPVFQLARKRSAGMQHHGLPDHDEVLQWFHAAGLTQVESELVHIAWLFDNPDMVVQHLLRGVSSFDTEMRKLPWDYRRTLINELIDRGRDVCRKYPLSERTVDLPCLMVKGRVLPKNHETRDMMEGRRKGAKSWQTASPS
jgi:ubiquinone/menaquinone biosynthesis C-methylase UbiE